MPPPPTAKPFRSTLLFLAIMSLTVGIGPRNPILADPRPTNPGITQNTVELLPYQAKGYTFLNLEEGERVPNGFANPDFDDSEFFPGKAAFGSGGNCPLQPQVSTAWRLNSRLLVRRTLSVPTGAKNVRIMVSVDNAVRRAYFNGHLIDSQIRHSFCPISDEFRIDVPQSLVRRDNVIAFELVDQGVESFFDARVLADLRTPPLTGQTPSFSRLVRTRRHQSMTATECCAMSPRSRRRTPHVSDTWSVRHPTRLLRTASSRM
jgi:hypothetical protein